MTLDVDAGPFSLAGDSVVEAAARAAAHTAALVSSIEVDDGEGPGGSDGGGIDGGGGSAAVRPWLDQEERDALASALEEAGRWRVGVRCAITSTTFYELLLESEGDGNDNDDAVGTDVGGGDGIADEASGEEDGVDGDADDAEAEEERLRRRTRRAAARLQRRGLHRLANVRASFSVRVGCEVGADGMLLPPCIAVGGAVSVDVSELCGV